MTIQDAVSNPLIAMAVGFMGGNAKKILEELKSFVGWCLSPKGQKEIRDVQILAADFQAAAVDAGHPEPAQVQSSIEGILNALPVAAKALLIGFLCLGFAGMARADISLSGNVGAGGAVYNVAPGGSIEASGSMAATYGLNFAYVGVTSTVSPATYNYFILSVGGSYEPHVASTGGYVGAYVEIGTQIPDSPANIMIGTIGNLFTGAANPFGIVAAVNFPIGQIWHTWK